MISQPTIKRVRKESACDGSAIRSCLLSSHANGKWNFRTSVIMFLCSVLLTGSALGVRPGPQLTLPSAVDWFSLPAPEREMEAALTWSRDLNAALAEAALEQQYVIAVVTTRGCPHSRRLKEVVLQHPDLVPLLRQLVRVEIDAATDIATTTAYSVRNVPTVLILTADGRELQRFPSGVSAEILEPMLRTLLEEQRVVQTETMEEDWVEWLDGDSLTRDQWRFVLGNLNRERVRSAVRQHLNQSELFPRAMLVEFLEDPLLAVRLAALELLEERTGDDFGFDPWQPHELLAPALDRWRQWAIADTDTQEPAIAYAVLTAEQVERHVRDMMSDERMRSLRAMQSLIRGGPAILPLLDTFVEEHPDLPAGILNRLREIRYAVLLQEQGALDAAAWAQRLVFSHQDAQIHALRELAPFALQLLPILQDHLQMEDPLIRETAIETLLTGAGPRAVPILREHAENESNPDVLITLLRGVSQLRGNTAARMLLPYLDHDHEDVVIAVLQGIQRMRARIAEDDVVQLLEDSRWRVRVAALDAIAALRSRQAEPYFEALFHDPEEFVRYKAVQVFAAVQPDASIDLLEGLFERDDGLKGAVIAAICNMDRNPPRAFAELLGDQPAHVLLSVTEALGTCGVRGASLAASLATHSDADVALSALRVVGQHGLNDARHRSLLLDALESGDTLRATTALEAMSQARDFWQPSGFGFSSGFMSSTFSAEEEEYDEELHDLFDAFLGPSSEPEPEPEPSVEADVDDILDLFMDQLAATSDDNGDQSTRIVGRTELLQAVQSYLDHEDVGMRYQAGLISIRARQLGMAAWLERELNALTVGQRTEIARTLSNWHAEEALTMIDLLLRDSAEQVRAAAVNTALRARDSADWMDRLFDALEEPDTQVNPANFMTWSLRSIVQQSAVRARIRSRAVGLLDHPQSQIQALGVVLIEGLWRANDQDYILPLLEDSDPFVRRAAARAIGRNQPRLLVPFLETLVSDGAEQVREVLPGLMHAGYTWTHRFSSESAGSDHFPAVDMWRRLTPDQRSTWIETTAQLVRDPSPDIRLAAYFALASRGERIDVSSLMATLQRLSDPSRTANRVAHFLDQSLSLLDESFAPLISYVGQSSLSREKQEAIRTHFDSARGERETASVEYRVRPDPVAAIADGEEGDETEEVEPLPVRLVFFDDPNCPDCERVKEYLNLLAEWYPDLEVEQHQLLTARTMNLNEEYAEHFDAPITWRSITPAIVGGGGFLAGDAITYEALESLIVASMGIPDQDWHVAALPAVDEPADEPIEEIVEESTPWTKSSGTLPVALLLLVICAGLIGCAIISMKKRASRHP